LSGPLQRRPQEKQRVKGNARKRGGEGERARRRRTEREA